MLHNGLMHLPDGMSQGVFAALLATSFVGSFITVAFGIGGGALLLAVMATLVPPAALIPTHGVVQIGSNLGRAAVTFRHIFWPALPAFTLGSAIGAGIGGSLAVSLPPAWVQIGVGSFVIWSVLGRPPKGVRDWPLTVGAISSFLTMFFGARPVRRHLHQIAETAAPRSCGDPCGADDGAARGQDDCLRPAGLCLFGMVGLCHCHDRGGVSRHFGGQAPAEPAG